MARLLEPIATELVATELRAEIARKQLSITEVADRCGMTPSTLTRKLRALYPFNTDELEHIAHVLGINLQGLFSRIDAEREAAR